MGEKVAEKDDELGKKIEIECLVCETKVYAYWDDHYKGYRAKCTVCGYNWPES